MSRLVKLLSMSIDYWINRLEDQIEMFALVRALRSLGGEEQIPQVIGRT
jgi:hypothetical protein